MPVNTRVQASCGSRFSDQHPGPESNIDLNGDPWTTGTPRRPERLRPQVGARGSGEPGGVEAEGDGRRGVRPGAHEMLSHRGRWRFSWKQKRKCAEKSRKAGSHPKSVHAPGGRGAPASLSLVPDDSRVPPRPRPRRPPPALTACKPRSSLCHSFCLKIYFHPFTSWLSLPEIQRERIRKKWRDGFGGAAGKGTPEKAPRTTSERSVSGASVSWRDLDAPGGRRSRHETLRFHLCPAGRVRLWSHGDGTLAQRGARRPGPQGPPGRGPPACGSPQTDIGETLFAASFRIEGA